LGFCQESHLFNKANLEKQKDRIRNAVYSVTPETLMQVWGCVEQEEAHTFNLHHHNKTRPLWGGKGKVVGFIAIAKVVNK
jgi:hypothetical protein